MAQSYHFNKNHLDLATSGETLTLTSPNMSNDELKNLGVYSDKNLRASADNQKLHTNPNVTQKTVLKSHRNIMRDNVAKFIRERNLGDRHFQRQ